MTQPTELRTPNSELTAIELTGVSKTYQLYERPLDRLKQALYRRPFGRTLEALKPLSLTIQRGETVGIVGRNGSGKSTLLQLICGTLTPTLGQVTVQGRISALLELGAGFNPDFSGRENVFLNAAILGLSEKEIKARYPAIVEFSGLEPHLLEQPVKTYSSGMYVRLAFAIAISVEPDILVIDEALSVGDESFQRKCFARLRQIQQRGGTILFVSHSSATIIDLCDRAILLEHGELVSSGLPKSVIAHYHKLIYAPVAEQPQILEDIRNRQDQPESMDEEDEEEKRPATLATTASYNPEMKPESTVVYASHGATISTPQITTPDGRQVNQLLKGEEYRLTYDVRFDTAAEHVRFGMIIKTKSGMELGGGSTAHTSALLPHVAPEQTYTVSFRFRALLAAGSYFMNCGCSGAVNGHDTFLHRITDAVMFRVLPGEPSAQTGTVDFLVDVAVTDSAQTPRKEAASC